MKIRLTIPEENLVQQLRIFSALPSTAALWVPPTCGHAAGIASSLNASTATPSIPLDTAMALNTATATATATATPLNTTTTAATATTPIRFAGGWVRDKLLNLPSHDIDIAIPLLSGYTFALSFRDFLLRSLPPSSSPSPSPSSPSHPTPADCTPSALGRVAANPLQSKHLETACMAWRGLQLDFVALRSETYAEQGGRIPTGVSAATAEMDAFRRDITINSLFYNIESSQVEDFTGQGIRDLQRGIIRTPLPPMQTFSDDPLRVLRCVRFAARLAFRIDPPIVQAARSELVRSQLAAKVSRERIGIEVGKMVACEGRETDALRAIVDCGIYGVVFCVPPAKAHTSPSPSPSSPTASAAKTGLDSLRMCQILDSLLDPATTKFAPLSKSTRRLLYLSAYVFDSRNDHSDASTAAAAAVAKKRKRGEQIGVPGVIAVGLELSGADVTAAEGLYTSADLFRPGNIPDNRVDLGLALRTAGVHHKGMDWRDSLLFACACAIFNHSAEPSAEERVEITLKYKTLIQDISSSGLGEQFQKPALLNGTELQKLTGMPPGKWLMPILHEIVVWSLRNPDGGKDECTKWYLSQVEGGQFDSILALSKK